MTYMETPADHAFTAFLANLTPSKVLRDRSAMFTKVERKRERFLREKSAHEVAQGRYEDIQLALRMAREMRDSKINELKEDTE